MAIDLNFRSQILHHRLSQSADLVIEGFESTVIDERSQEPFEGYSSSGEVRGQSQEDGTRGGYLRIPVRQLDVLWASPEKYLRVLTYVPAVYRRQPVTFGS